MKAFIKNFVYFLVVLILGILASLADTYPAQSNISDTTISNNKPNIIQLITDGVQMQSAGENYEQTENKLINENPFSSFDFMQFSNNIIKNNSNEEIQISSFKGDIIIKSGSLDSVVLTDEKNLTITSGGNKYVVNVRENHKPQVNIKPLYDLSKETIRLSKLQQKPGYIVRISDDRVSQLDWKVTGPVKYNVIENTDTSIVFEVTVIMFMSKSSFEAYDARFQKEKYLTGFTVNIKDRYAPHKLSPMGVFYFTEW